MGRRPPRPETLSLMTHTHLLRAGATLAVALALAIPFGSALAGPGKTPPVKPAAPAGSPGASLAEVEKASLQKRFALPPVASIWAAGPAHETPIPWIAAGIYAGGRT